MSLEKNLQALFFLLYFCLGTFDTTNIYNILQYCRKFILLLKRFYMQDEAIFRFCVFEIQNPLQNEENIKYFFAM